MPRIRSIKPGFCMDDDIAKLTIPARLHLILLGTYADDEGRGPDNLRVIKGQLWPQDDDVTLDVIEGWHTELAMHGWICRYLGADEKAVFQIRNFRKHQKPNRPTPSTITAPTDADIRASLEHARTAHASLTNTSVIEQGEVTVGGEWRGGVSGCANDAVIKEPELSTTPTDGAEAEVVNRAVTEARKALGKTRPTTVTPMFKKKDPA